MDLGVIAIKGHSTFNRPPRTGASPSDGSLSCPGHSLGKRALVPTLRCSLSILQPPAGWAGRGSHKCQKLNVKTIEIGVVLKFSYINVFNFFSNEPGDIRSKMNN